MSRAQTIPNSLPRRLFGSFQINSKKTLAVTKKEAGAEEIVSVSTSKERKQ